MVGHRKPSLRRRSISSWLGRAACGGLLWMLLAASCARSPYVLAPPAGDQAVDGNSLITPTTTDISARHAPTPAASIVDGVPTPAPPLDSDALSNYATALRYGNFLRAAELMDAATPLDQQSPELRYARALAALELGDVDTALRKIELLEQDYPAFSEEVVHVRTRAARLGRDVSLMGATFRPSTSQQKLSLAEAHEQNASWAEARKLASDVVLALGRSTSTADRELLARARALRARSLEAEGKNTQAATELKWLALHAAHIPTERMQLPQDYDEHIARLDAKQRLTQSERLGRARTFSEQGFLAATERELLLIEAAGGSFRGKDGLIAWALYKSRDDPARAAASFAQAAQTEPTRRVEFLYYQAKSLARAQQDEQAVQLYDRVAGLGGTYAEHAQYQAAHVRMTLGDFAAAAHGFERYLKSYGRRAQHRAEAEYGLAITHLAAHDYAQAIAALDAVLAHTEKERDRANLLQLTAVALLGNDQANEAAALFHEVIELRPLSTAAMLAASRLQQMGMTAPPLILPAPAAKEATLGRAPLRLSLPEKVWRLARVGLDTEAELALRDQEQSLRAVFGERAGEALCETYGLLESAQRRYQVAQSAADFSLLKYARGAQTAWHWNCVYPQPYGALVAQHSRRYDVPEPLIYGVIRQESAFRPQVMSAANAVGLMQIIPPTAERIAAELGAKYDPVLMTSPATNIRYGVYYLRRLLDMVDGRVELAVAAYNAGPSALFRWLETGQSLPLDVFIASIPYTETRNYVYQVLENYTRYAYLSADHDVPKLDLALPQGLTRPHDAY